MQFQRLPTHGFTTKSSSRVSVLINEIHVSEASPQYSSSELIRKPYYCIWDTGATGTVISRKVADSLGLQPSGKVTVRAVGSGDSAHEYETNTYLVNLYLPNNVCIIGARVAEGSISGGDVLIGMDIIGEGDFAVTNHDGKTTWTFRVPSCEEIDFVQEINEYNKRFPPVEQKRRDRNKKKAEKRKRSNK